MVIALALALLALAANEAGYRSAQHFDNVSSQELQARLAVNHLQRLLVAAESAQRGYLITARIEYKQAYGQAHDDLQNQLADLPKIFGPLTQHQSASDRLEKAARERVSELDEVLRLFDAGETARAVSLVLTDIGREKMLAVDEEVERIEGATLDAFVAHQKQLQRALFWSHLGVALLTVFGLIVLLVALQQLRERDAERAKQQGALQAERDKLLTEVEHRTAELTELASYLQRVREDERSRLAAELHDELGGLLTATKLDIARVRNKLGTTTPDVTERIAHMLSMLDAGIALKRRIIEDLRPSSLRDFGLKTALSILCGEFAKSSAIKVVTHIDDVRLDEPRALSVYRLVQEALTNVAKHAGARRIEVTVRATEGGVCVSVTDDGCGFDVSDHRPSGHGLTGMRFRIRSGGGQMHVHSTLGTGTTIEATLPCSA